MSQGKGNGGIAVSQCEKSTAASVMAEPAAEAFERGTQLAGAGRHQDALAHFEHAVISNPREPNYWLSLVETRLRLQGLEAALETARQGERAAGGQPALTKLCALLEQSLAREDSSSTWEAEVQRVQQAIDRGEHAAAETQATEITQRWPKRPDGWRLLAEARHRRGDSLAAIEAARQALALAPEDAGLHINLGIMLRAGGQLEAAETVLRRALELAPESAQAHAALGALQRRQEDLQAAEASYRRALALDPMQPRLHFNLGLVLEQLGQERAARESYRRALALEPNLSAAANNLGNLLQSAGQLDDARALFEQAIGGGPGFCQAYFNLGNVLRLLDQPEGAVRAFENALACDPNMVDVWKNLALTQQYLGCLDDAEKTLRQALDLYPSDIDLIEGLALLLGSRDRFRDAASLLEQAVALEPDSGSLHQLLARAWMGCGLYEKAEAGYRHALELEPDSAKGYLGLAGLYVRLKRYSEAFKYVERSLEIDPDCAGAHYTLGRLLLELGRLDEVEQCYRRAQQLEPDSASFRSDLLQVMGFTCHWSTEQQRRESEKWELDALTQEEREQARSRRFGHSWHPARGRRLRLGLLSSELGQHAVGYFLLSWLRALDRDRFELFMYPGRDRTEAQVELFRSLADHWAPVAGLNDKRAAERIRGDEIDLLIDTTGHDGDNRIGVIAHRAAPVQCHYIGYYATTGLSQMDYFIGDPVLIPPEHDDHFTEQVWRLPRTRYAYLPLEEAPPPHWDPDPDGTIWVGSFNNLIKVRDETLVLWARVLRALPEARLALKDSKGAESLTQRRVFGVLAENDIPAERIAIMQNVSSWPRHMAYYNHLDLALDSVPFNSATTGFDALWMGCPLVTILGDRLAGRQAASLLTGLGRPEWIARDADEYVQIAVQLARDKAQRRRIREEQRERMRTGELCDGAGLARVLEDSFIEMVERASARAR